jgi:hypothetical protein
MAAITASPANQGAIFIFFIPFSSFVVTTFMSGRVPGNLFPVGVNSSSFQLYTVQAALAGPGGFFVQVIAFGINLL